MALVGKIKKYINGTVREFKISYSQKNGFSVSGFPDEVFRVANIGDYSSGFLTEKDLNNKLDECLKIYHEKTKTTKKVIVYTISLAIDQAMNRTGKGSFSGHNSLLPFSIRNKITNIGGKNGDLCFGFQISYEVFMKCEVATGSIYYSINEDGRIGYKSNIDTRSILLMDWSEERELFFKNMAIASTEMIKKMLSFFAQEEQALLSLIDAGGQKLIG